MRPNRLPTPIQLMDEPECAILAALDITLEIVENTVLAAHPELYAEEQPAGVCEESLAAVRLLGLIREMQSTIASYHRWLRVTPKAPANPPF